MYGRHFDDKGNIVSIVTRDSIDALKKHFREEMTDADWRTCIKLKKLFDIQWASSNSSSVAANRPNISE